MRLPKIADDYLKDAGFLFDHGSYFRLDDCRVQVIRPDKLRGGVAFNAMISFPSASLPIISPYEIGCVRADGTFGPNPENDDCYRTFKATSGKELLAGLEKFVLPQLALLSEGDLSVRLLTLLINPEGEFPPEYDVFGIPRRGTPARYLSLAGSLAVLGRFEEAHRAFQEIPIHLRREASLEIERAIVDHNVVVRSEFLNALA